MAKTNEKFLQEIKERNELIEPLEEYRGCFEKIRFRCLKHNIEFENSPNEMLRKCMCPICKKEKFKSNITRNHEEFLSEFRRKNSKSNEIEILEKYINSKNKILCKCKIDGYIWKASPKDLMQGSGCNICGVKSMISLKKNSEKDILKRLKEVHGDTIEMISNYIDSTKKVRFKCNFCNYEWEALPLSVLSGKNAKNVVQ